MGRASGHIGHARAPPAVGGDRGWAGTKTILTFAETWDTTPTATAFSDKPLRLRKTMAEQPMTILEQFPRYNATVTFAIV